MQKLKYQIKIKFSILKYKIILIIRKQDIDYMTKINFIKNKYLKSNYGNKCW